MFSRRKSQLVVAKFTEFPRPHQPWPCPASFKHFSNALISSTHIPFFSTMSPATVKITKKSAKSARKSLILYFTKTYFDAIFTEPKLKLRKPSKIAIEHYENEMMLNLC